MTSSDQGRSDPRTAAALPSHEGRSIILTDPDGVITTFDASAERLLGYRAEGVVGRLTPAAFVDPGELAARAGELGTAPGFEAIVHALEAEAADPRSWTCVRADGRRVAVSLTVAELRRAGEAGFVAIVRDLTEATAAPASEQSDLERMRAVFDGSLLPTVISRFADGKVLSVNSAFVALLGWRERDVVGRTMLEVGAWARPEERKTIAERLRSRDPVTDLEVQARTKRGVVKVLLTSLSLADFDDESCVVVHAHDVTERRRLESELRESEERFRQLAETLQQGFLLRDVDPPEVLYASPAHERIFGIEPGALYRDPRRLEDLIHPDDRERVLRQRDAITQATDYEFRIVRPDGATRWIRSRAEPVRMHGATAARIAVVSEDVTEERALRETLRASEQDFRLLAENSNDVITRVSPDGVVLYISPACRALYGYEPRELVGRSGLALVHPDDLAALRDEAGGGAASDVMTNEYRVRHRDGSYVWVETKSRAVRDPITGNVLEHHSSARDVSERKAAVAAIRRAKDEAEKANNAKSWFLSRMSHELRTPLHAILGFGELLERGELRPAQHEPLGQIMRAGRHLLGLIDEVLDLSRIERGELHLSLEPVDIARLVRETLELVRPLATDRSVSLRTVTGADFDVHALADRERLAQVLLNVLSNAVKYDHKGGEVSVIITRAAPARARVEVTDTGPGIPTRDVARVFEAFDRMGAEATDVEGTGLGLALSKRLIETMNGEMGIESAPGQGTTAWFELPAATAPGTPPDGDAPAAAAGTAAPAVGVLYVEDNPANVKLVERILGLRPHIGLIVAVTGAQGLAVAFERRPELVLLDLNLPDMSGEDVLRAIRADERTAATAVVMVSADATPGQVARLRAAGADAYLTKPFEIDEFLAMVDRWSAGDVTSADEDASEATARAAAEIGDAVDVERLERLRRLKPDGRALREVVELFLQDSAARMQALQTAARDGDAASVRRAAHAWAGACGLTGAERLAALLRKIEQGDGEVPDARSIEAVRHAYRDAATALTRALG